MSDNHSHAEALGKRLLLSMLINLLIPALQIIGGILAGSVALLSDAVHNLGDFTALLVAYLANKVSRRGPSARHTFGLRRVEILATVINSALLGGAAVYIAVEALHRLAHPTDVSVNLVIWFALIGIVGNGLSAILLHKDSGQSLNARGAFLHMLGDLLTSVAVLTGALIMRFFEFPWIDPVLSLVIVAYISYNSVLLLKAAIHVLMDGTPKGVDLETVRAEIEAISGVNSVHYMHAWSLEEKPLALTCHMVVGDQLISTSKTLIEMIYTNLLERFEINHPVLQFETKVCGQGQLLCQMISE
ncbi:MAG: cation diffusion facilitator family transporter [Candidatus Electryonea clarkiae]|nr:cation diffusion facilitator family transporter [Candidatus Electryonea clarkiae]MDP8286241.1 cation diffusion facilitator family transporter [Candidatus Electryonea clarkiae]